MASQKLCACDRTREKLISVRLDLVDTVHVPFVELLKTLSNVPESGVWLDHFRGIPKGPRLSRFDVIYLDQEARVLECIENFTEVEFEPLEHEAESALVLPPHSLASIRVRPGDQLRICRSGKVVAGKPLAPNERCIRVFVPDKTPEETEPAVPTSVLDMPKPKRGLTEKFLLWLFPEAENADRRNANRLPAQNLVAYYWTGGSPIAYKVADVSHSGLYLFTEERWLPGTRLVMTLQKESVSAAEPEEISRVESEVVRWGEDGIGCRFVESGFVDLNSGELVQGRIFDRKAFDQFLQHVTGSSSHP